MTQRVIITAGAAGIGRTIATRFADQGAEVHVCDIDGAALEALSHDYPAIVGDGIDVTSEAALDGWLEDCLEEMGGCDVLVNNAGIAGEAARVEDLGLAAWRQCLAVNLDAQMLTCRRVVPVMKQQKSGSIINMSSNAGLYGYPFRTPYAAAKWAVIGFTKSVASEVGPWNIRCNAICPAAVEGERMDRVIRNIAASSNRTEDNVREEYTAGTSMRRFATADEVADLCLFLGSDAARFISGQAIAVDGNTETFHSE